MNNLKLPASLTETRDEFNLARGPFTVTHNGHSGVGAFLQEQGDDELSFWDGERTRTLDSTYSLRTSRDRATFYSAEYDSRVELRPLSLDSATAVYPGRTFADLAEFSDELLADLELSAQPVSTNTVDQLSITASGATANVDEPGTLPNGKSTPLPEGETLAATEDDEGNVLELIFTDETGTYARIPAGEWTKVNTDEDQPTIDDRVWVDVNEPFVRVYDSARSADDPVTDADLAQYRADAA